MSFEDKDGPEEAHVYSSFISGVGEASPKRAELLRQAEKLITGDREQEYGKPEVNFANIAELWTVYLSSRFGDEVLDMLNAEDVAWMMLLVKMARSISPGGKKDDTYIDAAGYAALAGELRR